jgi:hypothetical protein
MAGIAGMGALRFKLFNGPPGLLKIKGENGNATL